MSARSPSHLDATARGLSILIGLVSLAGCGSSDSRHDRGPTEFDVCPTEAPIDIEVARQLVGTNGTFVDHCDSDGDLVVHQCVPDWKTSMCSSTGGPDCEPPEPVMVAPDYVDCLGTCEAGSCERHCPGMADPLVLTGGQFNDYSVENEADGSLYQCLVESCESEPQIGDPVVLLEAPFWFMTCAGPDRFTVVANESCRLACLYEGEG